MAHPSTYVTWNDKTTAYRFGNPIAYSAIQDAYVEPVVVRGVPDHLYSYIVTSEPRGNRPGFFDSTVGIPATPREAAKPWNLTLPAGANTSLGGLIDAFDWGAVDVVMNQCFGGDFAFNIQGSLQGAQPAGAGAVVRPRKVIGYSFASGANYNELSFGRLVPDSGSFPGTATALGDFTQGWAFLSTNTAGGGAPDTFTVFQSYDNGRNTDPFVIGGVPYGVPNQVPTTNGNPTLRAGGFESPVYASSDAPMGGNVNEAAANNARTLATTPAKRWAILLAMTPDRFEFMLDIERQYAALISNGVPRNHIAVLYGEQTPGELSRFTKIAADNNFPDVNGIFDAVRKNFVPVLDGATSKDNIRGLLDLTRTRSENPDDPAADQVNYWQFFNGSGRGGDSPATGDLLFLYVTGHGSAENVFGGNVLVANRAAGASFTTEIKLTTPGNVEITQGKDVSAQITTRGPLLNLGADTFSVNGFPIGGATSASLGVDAFDVNRVIDESASEPRYYYNVTIPAEFLTGGSSDGRVTFSITSTDQQAVASFTQEVESITLMDDIPDVCATGSCDMYTDIISPTLHCEFDTDGDGVPNLTLADADHDGLCEWPEGTATIPGTLTFTAATPVEFSGTTNVSADRIVVEAGSLLKGDAASLVKLTLVARSSTVGDIVSDGTLDISASDDIILQSKRSIDLSEGATNLHAGDKLVLKASTGDVTVAPAIFDANGPFTLFARNRVEINARGANGSIDIARARVGSFRIVVNTKASVSVVGDKHLRLSDHTLLTTDATKVGIPNSSNIDLTATGRVSLTEDTTLDSGRKILVTTNRTVDDVCLTQSTTIEAANGFGRISFAGVKGTVFDDGTTTFVGAILGDRIVPGSCP
jgi:hypothetical protein